MNHQTRHALYDWAWSQGDITPNEMLILLALCRHADGVICFPIVSRLQEDTHIEPSVICDCVRSLAANSLIRRYDAGQGVHTYLTIPKLPKQKAVKEHAFAPAADMELAMAHWNNMANRTKGSLHPMPFVRKLTDAVKLKLTSRLAEGGLEGWVQCVEAVEKNSQTRGMGSTGWRADFNYLLQPKGYSKTINGGWPPDYEEKSNGGQRARIGGRGDERTDRLRGLVAGVRGRASEDVDSPRGRRTDHQDTKPDGRGAGDNLSRRALSGPDQPG